MGENKAGDHFLKGYKDLKIYTHSWPVENPKALVLIVHGFAEHCRRYDHLASHLNQQNINCIGIDLYGHGQTEGLKGHVDKYDLFLDLLDQFKSHAIAQFPNTPMFIYGHSMGGNIVLNYLFKRKPNFKGVIVTGPWIDLAKPAPKIKVIIGKALRNILPRMLQPTELQEHLLSRDQSVGEAYIADPLVQTKMSNALGIDILKAADYLRDYNGKTPTPLLIMHGDKDQIIAPGGSEELSNKISGDVSLKLWPEFYHEIQNEIGKEEVFTFTSDWIKEYI